jgi:hypothetical protein
VSLEARVPQKQPLRKLRALLDAPLATMNAEFEAVDGRRGRPSVPPEMLRPCCYAFCSPLVCDFASAV